MTRILAMGIGPLLAPGVKKVGGQCLRTWHLIKPLLDKGHQISLLTIPIPDTDVDLQTLPPKERKEYKGFPYVQVNRHSEEVLTEALKEETNRFKPDVLLGINIFPSYIMAKSGIPLPFWADLNGYCLVEGQTKCYVYGDDQYLSYFWKLETSVVIRADKFSTVSRPQLYALLGELAFAGRLNRLSFDYVFAHWIPNAVNEMYLRIPEAGGGKLKGNLVPSDSFVVLWSGGFNTWTDVDFLFNAMESVMSKCPEVYFVATGGKVNGHDEVTYERFVSLVNSSPFRKRYILCGWIEAELIPHFYAESDLGVNVDSFNYETIFGARNRLVNMMASGLPVLTTLGTEISCIIKDEKIGFTVEIGDEESFARTIIQAVKGREELQELGKKAREFVLKRFSYEKTTEPLIDWMENPSFSPDNKERFSKDRDSLNEVEQWFRTLSSGRILEIEKAQRELERLRSSKFYKIYRYLKRLIRR